MLTPGRVQYGIRWWSPGSWACNQLPSARVTLSRALLRGRCHRSPSCGVQPTLATRQGLQSRYRRAWGAPARRPMPPGMPAAAARGTAGSGAGQAWHHVLPACGRAGSRHRQLLTWVWGAPAPAPLCPRCLATPQSPALRCHAGGPGALSCDASEHRAAAPTAATPGTFRGDARHPPRRCQPSLPSPASWVPTTPGCQPSPAPAPGPSPTHAGCRQAAGRLRADALCLGLLQG